MKNSNGQLSRSFFSSQVLDDLRNKIISGEIAAGDKLVETKIASEMNTSRGPVRKALFILENEGLVSFLSNGRTESAGFSLTDAENLYEMRAFLEIKAIQLIFKRDQSNFQQIKQINNDLRKEINNVEKFTSLDINYHYELLRLSGNKYLSQCWLSLRPLIETILMLTNTQVRENENDIWDKGYVINHHDKITEGLLSGDLEQTILFIKEHLDKGKAFIESRLSVILKS